MGAEPTRQNVARLARRLSTLRVDGYKPDALREAVRRMVARGLGPGSLDEFLLEAQVAVAPAPWDEPDPESDGMAPAAPSGGTTNGSLPVAITNNGRRKDVRIEDWCYACDAQTVHRWDSPEAEPVCEACEARGGRNPSTPS
jgi:hypothetical protein